MDAPVLNEAGSFDRRGFFIGGEWVAPSSSARFTLINATTEEPFGSVPEGVEADMDRAVAAARRAFDQSGWATMPPVDRAVAINRFADAIEKRVDLLAKTVTMQNGMPIATSQTLEGGMGVGTLRYYAGLAAAMPAEETRPSQIGKETVVSKGPIGVVAAIVPWNAPVVLAISKIGPALAAGCTIVVKPSPNTSLDSYILADAAEEAALPPGVINWVPGDRAAGAYLVSHPQVDKVAFTGSTAAGRAVARTCGELLRPVTLELGGKSAAILLEDADIDTIWPNLQFSSLLNSGQVCFATSRVLAPQSRYKAIVEALSVKVAAINVGDPMEAATEVGPMATEVHRERVEGYIAKGKGEARLVAGGGRPKAMNRGWFVEPTLFADVGNSATIAQEEIFGPVLTVIPYEDEADAVRIANDSIYGLGGAVYSADAAHAHQVARRVNTGTIGVNGYPIAIGSPFGGVKQSGLGREFGPEALSAYQQWKSIYVAA